VVQKKVHLQLDLPVTESVSVPAQPADEARGSPDYVDQGTTIGAGPVGLAAAAHLVERKMPFVVFEAGPRVGNSALAWGHVQLFSPWQYCIDPAAARLLETTGWQAPDPEGYPTGRALVEQYLGPLASHAAIAPLGIALLWAAGSYNGVLVDVLASSTLVVAGFWFAAAQSDLQKRSNTSHGQIQ
jgi:2-polyprenyl-6-methoxyphenol hydroxylase-like FAD-dependent oxidoreductase